MDYIVTKDTIKEVREHEEFTGKNAPYKVIVGIPAAFTPICGEELQQLFDLHKAIETQGMDDVELVTIMLDQPYAVQAWLKELKAPDDFKVFISEAAVMNFHMRNGDQARPVKRSMVVLFSKGLPGHMEYEHTWLANVENHMDIPRNIEDALRVIEHHKENRLS